MLNAKQIVDEGLLLLENAKGKPAQVGFDITLKSVNKVGNRVGNTNVYGAGDHSNCEMGDLSGKFGVAT